MTRAALIVAVLVLAGCGIPGHQVVVSGTTTTTVVGVDAGWVAAVAQVHTTTTVAREFSAGAAHTTHIQPTYNGDIPDLIRTVFARFGPTVAEQAVQVAWCESRHNPQALGRAGEISIFQIHPRYHKQRAARLGFTLGDLWDPYVNTLVAADLYAQSGWGPWSCKTMREGP